MSILNMRVGGGSTRNMITEFETGQVSPSSQAMDLSVSFSNTHTTAPSLILVADDTGLAPPRNSNIIWFQARWEILFGGYIKPSYNGYGDNLCVNAYDNVSQNNWDELSSDYSTSTTGFHTECVRYFKPERTYTWIALWIEV